MDKRALIVAIIGILVTVLIGGSGWAAFVWQWREKNRERAEKETEQKARQAAQAELAQIRRRAIAPFFARSNARPNGIYWERGPGGNMSFVTGLHHGLLCGYCREVKIRPEYEQIVVFLVENLGHAAASVRVKLDGAPITLCQEAQMNDAGGHQFLVYPYDAAKHGQEQKITVAFETAGIQDLHTYRTRHGFGELLRIDPPLPE